MAVPSFFIVGAPRCGTSSLYLCLSAHPQVFVCRPQEPARVYAETLAFLGLEAPGTPEFKAHNQRRRWRNQRLAGVLIGPYRRRSGGHSRCPP